MAQQHIDLGTPPSGTDGDTDRGAWTKAEANFTDLYGIIGAGSGGVVDQVEQNTEDIAALQANDATQDGEITAIQTKDTAQDGLIAANGTDIATLKTQVAAINPAGGFKNKLINGNFDFWQRGTNFPAGGYSADRWSFQVASVTGITAQQGIFPPGDMNGTINDAKYFYSAGLTGNTDAAAHYCNLAQRIEGVQTFANKNAVLSFRAFNPTATPRNIAVSCNQNFGVSGSATVAGIGQKLITLAQGWNYISVPMTFPAITGKTIGATDNVTVVIWLSAGTNFASQAANLGAQSGSLYFSAVQMEAGSNATPFELRPLAAELALCQRYYEKSYNTETNPGTAGTAGATGAYSGGLPSAIYSAGNFNSFKVTKRATPSLTAYSPQTGAAGMLKNNVTNGDLPASLSNQGANGFFWFANNLPAANTWNIAMHWTADAEI